jgi:hypothetical protein
LQQACFLSTSFISFSELVVSSTCPAIVCMSTQQCNTYLLGFIPYLIRLLFEFWGHFGWGSELLPGIFLPQGNMF